MISSASFSLADRASATARIKFHWLIMISDPHFESDPFPGNPRILFIGIAGSSHTVSWIDLLAHACLNVRLFAMPDRGLPRSDWEVRTYLSTPHLPEDLDPRWRSCSHPTPEEVRARAEAVRQALQASRVLRIKDHLRKGVVIKPYEFGLLLNLKNSLLGMLASLVTAFMKKLGLSDKGADLLLDKNSPGDLATFSPTAEKALAIFGEVPTPPCPDEWLAKIIREWRPDIIHTLGLTHDQGGLYYYQVRQKHHLAGLGRWVLQLRGGSDLTLNRHDPLIAPVLASALSDCDQIISDNLVNADYVEAMGVPREKIAPISPVPGAGGIDITALRKTWTLLPSKRERLILWPKAYDSIWSVALPVFEALKIAWARIKPCRIIMLCLKRETAESWFRTLPEEIQESTQTFERIPHHEALEYMSQARVMLAPSLVDGIPNVLYEAMACGAFPVVSPIETISRVVVNEQNGFLARNLFPDEIAQALIRAMNDDTLVDETALHNLGLVEKLADRNTIGPKVVAYYESLGVDSQEAFTAETGI